MVAAGHVSSTREAFDLWLGRDRPAFVPRSGPSPETVIAAIHAAPEGWHRWHIPAARPIDARIPALRDAGLDAIEVYHSDHDHAASDRYRRLADDLGLLMTGGSDYHGDPAHGVPIGSFHASARGVASVCTRRGIDMPAREVLVQLRKVTKDYRSLRPLRVESLDLHEGRDTGAWRASIG